MTKQTPLDRLKHHVTGAIERGEKTAIVGQPAKLFAYCVRTQMVGGGTSYDVYFRIEDKPSRPLHNNHTYATEIHHGEHRFYRVYDAIDRKARWSMSAGMEKWETRKRHEKVSNRLAFRIAKRAFPELKTLKALPSLWASWNAPTETKRVAVKMALPE